MDMKNTAGKTVAPEMETFQAAAANADWTEGARLLPDPDQPAGRRQLADHRRDLHPGPQASRRTRPTPPKRLKFFDWAYANGDDMAAGLDYIPMPDSVVDLVHKTWETDITADGKPVYTPAM